MFSLLAKTMKKTTNNITSLLGSKKEKIHKDELEELLIESDVAYEIIESLLDSLPTHSTKEQLERALLSLLSSASSLDSTPTPQNLEILLIIGINGAGKTTTIAKLANKYKHEGKKVLLGAGDTFRAAAIEQLKSWGERLQIPVIATKHGHDPSALAFDAISSACAKGYDVLLLDTAGRLHTQTNLTNELLKIIRVSEKALTQHNQNARLQKLLVAGSQTNLKILRLFYRVSGYGNDPADQRGGFTDRVVDRNHGIHVINNASRVRREHGRVDLPSARHRIDQKALAALGIFGL